MKLFIPFLIILSFIAISPSFKMGLYGDDWVAIWRFIYALDPNHLGQWSYLAHFLTAYGSFNLIMGFITKLFGFTDVYFYIISYIFRIIGALSFYPLIFYITKSRYASVFAVLFFSVTAIGLEATSWVFNMPVYLAVATFNIFLLFFIRSREEENSKLFIISIVFFILTTFIASVRITGVPAFVLLSEAFWIITVGFQASTIKKVLFRITGFLFSFIFLIFISNFVGFIGKYQDRLLGHVNMWDSFFSSGIKISSEMIAAGRIDFLFYPIITLGGMVLPILDVLNPTLGGVSFFEKVIVTFIVSLSIYMMFIILIFKYITNKKIWINWHIAGGVVWFFISVFVYYHSSKTLSFVNFLQLITGGYFLLLGILLSLKLKGDKRIINLMFISFAWLVLSFIIGWIRDPSVVLPTTHRYFLISVTGLITFWSLIISLASKQSQKRIFLILSVFIFFNVIASRNYLNNLALNVHNAEVSNRIWSKFPYIQNMGKTPQPLLFLFTGEDARALYGSITFGFPYHMALLYGIDDPSKMPIPVSEFAQVKSAVTDGKSLVQFELPAKAIPIENIYAFRLEGKDDLVNVTNDIRQQLRDAK